MARNKISDLHNLLFEQLECLITAETEEEEVSRQVTKAKAVSSIASNIVSCAELSIKAKEIQLEYGLDNELIPQLTYDHD